MKAFYSRERDSSEGLYDAEAMEQSALKHRKNFVRRESKSPLERTCEPKERVRSKEFGIGVK